MQNIAALCDFWCQYSKFLYLFVNSDPSAVTPTLQIDKSTQEIGDLAVWRVSSAKSGNGECVIGDGDFAMVDVFCATNGNKAEIQSYWKIANLFIVLKHLIFLFL